MEREREKKNRKRIMHRSATKWNATKTADKLYIGLKTQKQSKQEK